MEEYKQRYLQNFLHRNNKVSLEDYVEKIKAQEDKLRGCYGNAQHFKSSDKFVSIILVVAAFVIELLLSCHFFILEDLFDASKVRVKNSETERPSMIKLSYHFFRKVVGLQRSEDELEWTEPPLHFVDFIRTLHVQYLDTGTPEAEELPCIPSVTKLHQAGVKFRLESSNEISFVRSQATTYLRYNNYLSDYVFLLDKFVNTKQDVDLLVESEIVVNTIGDNNKVSSTMINQLCKGVAPDQQNFYFGGLADNLNKYCKKCRNRWLAYLSQKYFNSPWAWAAFSLFAEATLPILTVIQTVFAIISFCRQ
ncbi:unnamed protein product [Prunus armeniaca]